MRVRLGKYAEASAHFAKAVHANPHFSILHALHAAVLANGGRVDEARVVARRVLEVEPAFRANHFLEFAGWVEAETREALAVGIRQAGLPE